MTEIIDRFDGKYRFLSNFYPCKIIYQGIEYPSVEHAYQALKTLDINARKKIAEAATPREAKRMGRKVKLRKDWEKIKIELMEQLVKQKFTCYQDLRNKLLSTNRSELIEGNTWGDNFWGIYKGKGKNHLGKILMKVRNEIKKGSQL